MSNTDAVSNTDALNDTADVSSPPPTIHDDTVIWTSTASIDLHDPGDWHPERAARLPAVASGLSIPELGDVLREFEPRKASLDELSLAHDRRHLDALRAFVEDGGGAIDPDTTTSKGSWETALWAAGSGLAAVDELDRTGAAAALVAIRPPGHHATATKSMGFCLVNNAAVVAASLADRGERVAIFDWDVHHGNGTQDIFWNDERVLYASTHEHPAYPGTGSATEVGGADAIGTTINVPLPAGATGDTALAAWDELIGPSIERFAPSWIVVSAGFDAHRDDPLAGLSWTAGDYADLTLRVMAAAPQPSRVIVMLEGGYDLDALSRSIAATAGALAGVEHRPEPASNGGPGRDHVAGAIRLHEKAKEARS